MLARIFPLLALLALQAAAQENLFLHVPDPKSKTRVEAVALFSRPAPGGFLPVRITVNNGSDRNGSISVATTSTAGGYGEEDSTMNSSFTLEAPAEQSTRHDLLVPLCPLLSEGATTMRLRMSGDFGSNSASLSTGYSDTQAAVLLSEALYTPNASTLDAHVSSSGGFRGSQNFAGKFDPAQMPEDWRAYTGYDGIGMTDADWGALPPGAKTAILRWNRLGGQLVIYTLSGSTNFATLGISDSAGGSRAADRSFGKLSLQGLGTDLKLDPAETVRLFSSGGSTQFSSLRDDFRGGWPLQRDFGVQRYNYTLFILILVAFGVLVGPVNLFVFAKSGRRHRLFITTPLIALGTSALLVALIILIDGFGGRGIRIQLMEIRPDDGENSAYILQEQISRTGILMEKGFSLSEPAAISPVVLASTDNQWARLTDDNWGSGMRYDAEFRDGKLDLSGDWFLSRSEQGQFLRAVVPTRGRIELRNSAGAPSLLSTFEFPIETLFYRDASGGYWAAQNIEPGKAFTCTQTDAVAVAAFMVQSGDRLSNAIRPVLMKTPDDSLAARPGHFIAYTGAAPGVETFTGIDWKETRTYITGPIAKP